MPLLVLAMLLATGLLVGACSLLGQAVAALCGWRDWQWWSPALGLAILLALFGQAVRIRAIQVPLLVLVAIALVAALASAPVRRAVATVLPELLLVGVGMILLAAVPFYAAGHAGVLGPTVSNDMSQHLAGAFWFLDDSGMKPVAAIGGDLITTGYPLGPHALAAALSRLPAVGVVAGFSALTLAVPALTGLAALGLVKDARRGARWAFAAVIGLGYLPAAYLAQGSFKETILALLVFTLVVVLTDLGRAGNRPPWRTAIPLGLLLAGAVYAYSYGAALWMVATVGCFLVAEVLRRRALIAVIRDWAPPLLAALVAAAVVIAPEAGRVSAFRNSIFGQESLHNHGNLFHALNPLETLGVWFSGDFRVGAEPRWLTLAFCVLALVALVAGLRWWWRGRAVAVPAAIVAAIVVWAILGLTVNIYNAAKGLVVLAPLVMAAVGAPLAYAWSRQPGRTTSLLRGTGIVLLAGAVISSAGVLRSAPVGLGSHEREFAQIRRLVGHTPVLFLANDHFAQWELRGAIPIYLSGPLYAPARLGQHPQKRGGNLVDVDNYGKPELDKLAFVVTPNGRYTSEVPPNFQLALRTPSYDVYRRRGSTPVREPFESINTPGAVLDCSSPRAAGYEWAGVLPRPVVASGWRGSIARPGQTARITTMLPRGRWDVSMQYVSLTPVTVRGPGRTRTLAPSIGPINAYWDAGTVTSSGAPVTISATSGKRSWFAGLLGSRLPQRAPNSPGFRPLWKVAFTRHGATPQRTPIKQACGRYVDWLAPAGSPMTGRPATEAR